MTALGKTLVFFNLLFSLVIGGLIVMVFVTRTNWKVGMEAAQAETKTARAETQTVRSEWEQQRSAWANDVKKLDEEKKGLQIKIDGLTSEVNNQKQQAEAARNEAAQQTELAKYESVQVDRLQKERNQKDEFLKALNEQLIKTTNDLANVTQQEKYHHLRGDALEKDLSALKESYALLNKKYEEVKAIVSRDQLSRGATANAPRRPSIETTGIVLEAEGNIGVISLGSDNGIDQNHQLDVYRTTPSPLYLGKFTVTKSEPHRSVGIFEPVGKGKTIQKGDSVSSSILP